MTHKAVVVKVPQDTTADEWALAAAYAYSFRHTVTASHDDMLTILRGGSADSYVKLLWPRRQPDVPQMVQSAGYVWEEVPGFHAPRISLGHPFAYRYARTDGFNAPRTYANGLHEGIDWIVLGSGADKPVGVLAMLSGVVEKVGWAQNGYGNYVRVVSKADGYDVVLWYGHMDRITVQVGQRVAVGDVLGEVGNTGNSSGEHLHLTIQIPGYGLDGYCVDDVVDPSPFVPTEAQAATLPLYVGGVFDLMPYLCGDGRAYRVRNANGGSEIFQSQRDGNRFYQVKAWNDLSVVNYEEFILDGDDIRRDVDTSPGGGRYYRQLVADGKPGAPWVKRFMRRGERCATQKKVQFYWQSDCKPSADNSGNVQDTILFVAHYNKLRLHSGVEVEDVIQLHWEDGGEDYWYARGYGLVQWMRAHQDANSPVWSALSEMVDVGVLQRLKIPCL